MKDRTDKTAYAVRYQSEDGMRDLQMRLERVCWKETMDPDLTLDLRWTHFHSILKEQLDLALPLKIVKDSKRKKINTWFNENLQIMYDRLLLLRELSQCTGLPEFNASFLTLKKEYKKCIRKAKIEANNSKILNSPCPQKTSWDLVNAYRGKNPRVPVSCLMPEDFSKHFDLQDETSNVRPSGVNSKPGDAVQRTGFNFGSSPVTVSEIMKICQQLKGGCSMDHYGLSSKIFKRVAHLLAPPLASLISDSIAASHFPSALKVSIVVPILKKGNPEEVSNYRPISLLPVVSKVFEYVLKNRLCVYLEENAVIPNSQFGFRSGRNTCMAVDSVVRQVLGAFSGGLCASSTFVDLSRAFDCVSHPLLLRKLETCGLSGQALELMRSYLADRVQIVKYGGIYSQPALVSRGVPQGSVLGPLLFNVYVSDLPQSLPETHIVQYADDTTFTLLGKNKTELTELTGARLKDINTWCKANQLCLNAQKTVTLLFSVKPYEELMLESVKFLGLWIDPQLTWNSHCEKLCKRLSQQVFLLRCLSHNVSTKVLLSVYHACVHSLLAYGILLWGHATGRKNVFGLQRNCVRVVAGLQHREDCRETFRTLGIMTLPGLYIYHCLLYIKENEVCYPRNGSFHTYGTRGASLMTAQYQRIMRTQDGINYWCTKFYNKLPSSVKNSAYPVFKRKCSSLLLEGAFYDFSEYLACDIDTLV